jgi:integrase
MGTVYPLWSVVSTHFIPLHRKRYVFRVTIPRGLQPYFRRGQIWKSLKTNNRDQATLKSARWTAHIQALFILLKRKGANMTSADIDALVERWLSAEIESLEDNLADHCITDEYLEGFDLASGDRAEALQIEMLSSDYRKVGQEVDEILKEAGRPLLDHASIEFKRLCRRLLRAKIELVEIERDRVHGVYPSREMVTRSGPPAVDQTVKPSPLFSEVAKKYLSEKPRARRTIEQVEAEYEKFLKSIGGDRPIAQITKTEGRVYKDALIKRGLKPATIAVRLHVLSGLFTWASKQGYTPEGATHPIRGLAPERAEREKGATPIRPFTDEELTKVFCSPRFLQQRLSRPDRYWVTLICLYSLCRREEAAQLTLNDLGEKDGIPFIIITDLGENQSVKTPGSKRTIPIHSSLIALGFLDVVQTARRQGHKRLFHQLPLISHRYGGAISKWFAMHLDRVGLSQPELVMHSLRHGIHYLHALGCPQDVAEMLTGHTASSVHNKYEHRNLTPLTRLREGLECMQFPAVLDALRKGWSH